MPVRSETKPWGPPVKSSPKFEEESEKKIDLEFYEDTLELWIYRPVHKNWGSSTPLLAKCWKSTFNYIIDICMQEIIAIFAKTTWLWMLVFTNLWTIKNHRLHVNWHLSYLIKPLIIEMCCWKPLWNCLQNLALQRKILMINVTVLIRYCWHN